MATLGKSDFAQQKENERLLAQVNELKKKVTEQEKSLAQFGKNFVDLQTAVKLLQEKIK